MNLIVNDFYGNSLLHYAVSTSSYETVEFLLEIYRDSAEKFVNFHGITPAHIAAAKGDHRMLMAAAVASLVADGPVEMEDDGCWNVSYPGFPEQMRSLGVSVRTR